MGGRDVSKRAKGHINKTQYIYDTWQKIEKQHKSTKIFERAAEETGVLLRHVVRSASARIYCIIGRNMIR